MVDKKLNIYLDIDGVLNKSSQWEKMYQLNADNISNFADLVIKLSKKNDVSIILSSTWKNGFIKSEHPDNTPQIKELENELIKYNIRIAAKTPSYKGKCRDVEILSYQKYYESDYAIILDDSPEEFSKEYYKTGIVNGFLIYYTKSADGLSKDDVKKILKYIK